jgi:hypothetical protein
MSKLIIKIKICIINYKKSIFIENINTGNSQLKEHVTEKMLI